MIAALVVVSLIAFLFGIAAWIADRTEPDHQLYIVDDEAVRKLGEL